MEKFCWVVIHDVMFDMWNLKIFFKGLGLNQKGNRGGEAGYDRVTGVILMW
jgi:hypothetical protein